MRFLQFGLAVVFVLTFDPATARAQRAVYLVRHAEKDGDALTPTGKSQAIRLACLLRDSGVNVIYTSQFKRTAQTAEPLRVLFASMGFDLPVKKVAIPDALMVDPDNQALLDDYARDFLTKLRNEHPDEIVLIIGHDNTIPALIRGLGHKPAVTIHSNDFDRLFIVTPRVAGDPRPPGFFQIRHYDD